MALRVVFSSLFLGSIIFQAARGALYTDPSVLPQKTYDFVIVGAGTAGNVVANRLTEDPSFSVLVIEAGVDNNVNINTTIPFLSPELSPDTDVTWNFTTTPQAGLFNNTVAFPRGRVLGGCSSINHLVWTRGSMDDWNRYANVTGDDSWAWNNILPYMLKSETLVPPIDGRDTTGQVNPAVHGTTGPVELSLPAFTTSFDTKVMQTTSELQNDFPYNQDMNSGFPLGLGWLQSAITTEGRRASSATAYLEPAMNRSNLDVLINTQVTKLIPSNTTYGTLSFTQVEMGQNAISQRYTVTANNEVILSAGSIGTTQILLLSGIGDPTYLQSVNVTPIVNISDVGQNMADHALLTNNWFVNSNDTLDPANRNATLQAELFQQWSGNGTGTFAYNGGQLAWKRLNQTQLANFTDPSAGITSPHMELIPNNGFFPSVLFAPNISGNYMGVDTNLVAPASRGSVTLASNNPFDAPLINPNYYTDAEGFDIYTIVTALKAAKEFISASPWADFIISATPGLAEAETDEELANYARNNTGSAFHPIGTARMWSNGTDEGVVTSDLLVKGVSGLRVVDASVLPFVPGAHLQAVVYALAERGSDLIKGTWGAN